MQILEERSIRASYRLLKSYSDFVRRKFVMLSRFPKPRRKLWWEKLSESQYDHFYDDA